MLGTDFTKNKKAQSGSVMLEVIAVLALMGVMGAMLFRQIYQRNQELHNIQMASEIRTVKEAFSAYIQAHRTELLGVCVPNPDSTVLAKCDKTSAQIGEAIVDYLPMGWFNDGNPASYYTLSLWTYKLADASQKQVIHGLIAPKETTLPQTGWNFKRAARVALLIGADGGVYDNDITGNTIAGALGTWHLGVHGHMGLLSNTYVAMTGLDIFTPEYNLPEGQVNLPTDWDLATRKLGAWNYFSAGSDKATCFDVNHDASQETGGIITVQQDTFNACQPLFYVKKEDGISKVFVNNDLEIGQGEDINITITKEGVIKQKDGLTIDADGRIISKDELATDIGDLKNTEHYLLDPAHTSVMNDIYLTSRGGVRLSDILPNYILKGSKDLTCSISPANNTCKSTEAVPAISCPKGYNKAYLITPIQFATQGEAVNSSVSVSTNGTAVTNVTTTGNPVTSISLTRGTVTSTGDSVTKSIKPNNFKVSFNSADSKIVFTYSSNLNQAQTMAARVDSYCVFEPVSYTSQQTCEDAGFAWDSGKCIPGLGETECKNAGFTWDSTNKRCQYIYNLTNINAMSDATKKAATCKAAGKSWNGNTCA